MTSVPRQSTMRFVGTLLDRAVHDTFRHLWPLALPLALLDLFGFFDRGPWTQNWLTSTAVAAVINNRVRAILARSVAETNGKRLNVAAAVRYPKSFWFVLVEPLDSLPIILLTGAVLPAAIWGASAGRRASVVIAGMGVSIIVAVVSIVLLVVVMSIIIGSLAAFLDVVVDGMRPSTAARRWWRWTFRKKSFGSTLAVAGMYAIMFFGVSFLFLALRVELRWLHGILIMLTDGVADTIAFMLVWHWRLAVISRERGDDIFAGLDAPPAFTPATPA